MREHKYRAWDKVNKRWLEVDDFSEHIYYADKGCDKDGICKVWFGGTSEDENIIWLECTGLKDKNGKESYFDDVLKWRDSTFRVVWDDACATVMLKRLSGADGMKEIPAHNIKDSEVISNIYENPELLEVKK